MLLVVIQEYSLVIKRKVKVPSCQVNWFAILQLHLIYYTVLKKKKKKKKKEDMQGYIKTEKTDAVSMSIEYIQLVCQRLHFTRNLSVSKLHNASMVFEKFITV